MSKAIPIYTDHDDRFIADSCNQLARAVTEGKIQAEMLSQGHYPGRPLGPGVLPGLKMSGFWDAKADQDWGLPWHRNEGIELAFLERGALEFATDEEVHALRANDMTIVRPWQRHRLGDPVIRSSRLHWALIDIGVRRPHQVWKWPAWVVLSADDLAEITMILRQNEHPVWKTTPEIRKCFQKIEKCTGTNWSCGSVSRLSLNLNELLILVLEMLRKQDVGLDVALTTASRTVKLFLEDLRNHPEHLANDWSVNSMAAQCGLGVTQFTNYVKALVGVTPMQYVIQCRLELGAALLLCRPSAHVTDTALDCGFSSSQYFATAFSKLFGISPREYRKAGVVTRPVVSANCKLFKSFH